MFLSPFPPLIKSHYSPPRYWEEVVDWARNFGVVIDSGLMMSDHVTAVCHVVSYVQWSTFLVRWRCEDVSPGLHLVPTGLLQRTIVWHLWRSDSAPAVCAKRGSTAGHWSSPVRPHHTPVPRQLHCMAAFVVTNWLQSRSRPILVYSVSTVSPAGPPYLSDDCQLVTDVGRRHLRSADAHTCTVLRTQARLGDRTVGHFF